MPDNIDQSLSITRRTALTYSAAGAGVFAFGGGMPTTAGALSIANLDQMVAQIIQQKYSSFSEALNVLIPFGSRANMTPLVAAFKQATNISVNLIEVETNGINAELMLDTMLDRREYDVALPATFGLSDLVLANAILPLDQFARQYEPDGFRDSVLFGAGDYFEGSTFGFQTDGDAYLMFYNNELLENSELIKSYQDKFGLALTAPRTWSDLDRQMAFFHSPDDGRYGGALLRTPQYSVWEWWLRLHAKGVWPLSPEMTPQIDGDAGVEALDDMIATTQYQVHGLDTVGLFENWERYGQGDIYASIGWGGTQKYLNGPNSNVQGKMTFGLAPGGQFGDQTIPIPYFNWGWSYVVSSASPVPELAYLFCLFASSPTMSTRAVRQVDGFFDPFRPEHYSDPGVIEAYSEPFLKVHHQALNEAIPDFYLKKQSEYFIALGIGLDSALRGEIPPKAALNKVAQNWDLITNHTGRSGQISQWKRLRAQYPTAVCNVLRDIN
jgi:multiple sugar transport system substrate-binding protein